MIDAYPLTWPAGWKRTPAHQRTRAKFGKVEKHAAHDYKFFARGVTIAQATERVMDELGRFGVAQRHIIISSNLRLRQDGLPLSSQRKPDDPGVAVYWQDRTKEGKCMAIDRYDTPADNLAAVAATIYGMRAIERHGGAEILSRAFQGFIALPAPGQASARGWREVLGLLDGENLLAAYEAYKRLRSKYHPDKPEGDAAKFHEVTTAWEQAQAALAG